MTPFVDLHTHKASADGDVVSVVNLSATEDPCGEGFFSMGIHPWSLDDTHFDVEKFFAELERKLDDRRIVALGEAGLDRAHSVTLPRQMDVFERQVALSERFGLPLVIHNVRCTNELLAFRNRLKPTHRWIVHGFAAGLDEARQLIDHGFLLSVGAALFDNRRKIVNALPEIGQENLFFETDTSDVSIIKVYEKAAELLGLSVSTLCEDVWERFIQIHPLQ